jgi:hypothetical protein
MWSRDDVAVLTADWADGLSSGEIGRKLGVSRCAVASKRRTLGLPPRTGLAQIEAEHANGRRNAPRKLSPGRPKGAALAERLGPLSGSTPRPWVLRMIGECCFPVAGSGADLLSCCLPTFGGIYCLGHRAILAGRPWPPREPI